MIQSSYKPAELKAPERAKTVQSATPSKSNEVKKSDKLSAESKNEQNEFKNELKSAAESEPKVKPVEVSSDKALRAPSSLINENTEGHPETVSPKVFDPALTEGVQNLIDPQTVSVDAEGTAAEELLKQMNGKPLVQNIQAQEAEVEVAPEISEALLKLQKAEGEAVKQQPLAGRSPAIDLAKSEIDPQLLNMEDFVAQKNAAMKKQVPQGAYGMKNPAMNNKVAAENGLKSTEVVKDISMLENASGNGTTMNSQQFILNSLAEQGTPKLNEAQAPMKTFDMSQIKTADADKVMNQITDYIVQAKAAKEPTVNMRVNHQDLGMIDITVMKSGVVNSDAVAINIGAHTAEGKSFFQQNTKELFSHLSNAGISVADMKVETASSSSKSDFDFNQQNQKHAGNGSEKQFGSEQNQRRHEQQKREDLWKMFNKEAA